MAKYNAPAWSTQVTKNAEGNTAYKLSHEMELYSAVVTTALNDKFYEKGNDTLDRIRKLVAKCNPIFVAQLAVYAREQMYLRTIPLVLTVELARLHKGDNLVRRLAGRIIQRADEMGEILAYYAIVNANGNDVKKLGNLSIQLKKGIADAFNKFDEYQFGKYKTTDKEVSLKDAMFVVHPVPKDNKRKTAFKKIANDSLPTPYTWETELSELGQQKFKSEAEKAAAFKAKWESLIESGKLGYMALMRNLRNILEAGVEKKYITMVCNRLSDPAEVARSRQFPFRFLAAYAAIEEISGFNKTKVMEALEAAIKASVVNVAGFDEDTDVFITVDTSGSMSSKLSGKSSMWYMDIGIILGMILQHRCKSTITSIFGTGFKVITTPRDNILENSRKLQIINNSVGSATNGHLAIEYLIKNKIVADKIMMFTDCQLWDTRGYMGTVNKVWHEYKKNVAPNAKLYFFDVAGYGNTPINIAEKDVYLISGWSDRVFEVLENLEKGGDILKAIKEVTL